ncbi:FAD-dependent oxidoreductase, partial [Mycobacterium tuberculosis]|nr:FAD-dependent oxidoreductase [Mycobacterium tuberculosis]
PLKSRGYFEEHGIELRLGSRATEIDRAGRTVALTDGTALEYAHLVLATGSRPRRFAVPGHDLDGVAVLRTIADARRLSALMAEVAAVVIVGAGFVGLELAATLAGLGKRVTVVEAASRV